MPHQVNITVYKVKFCELRTGYGELFKNYSLPVVLYFLNFCELITDNFHLD